MKTANISINKLGEYMEAGSSKRKSIVQDAKYPQKYKSARYTRAREIIRSYIISGYDRTVIQYGIDELKNSNPKTDWIKDDVNNSILALENAAEMQMPDFTGYAMKEAIKGEKLVLSDVSIKINPDLLLFNRKTSKHAMVKIHIIKGATLNEESLKYISTILMYHQLNKGVAETDIDHTCCVSLDIFKQSYECSTKSYKRRIAAVEAACEEINLWWDKL